MPIPQIQHRFQSVDVHLYSTKTQCNVKEEARCKHYTHNWYRSINFTVHFHPRITVLLSKYLHFKLMIWAKLCAKFLFFWVFHPASQASVYFPSHHHSRQTKANDETSHTKLQNEGENFVTLNRGYRSIVT